MKLRLHRVGAAENRDLPLGPAAAPTPTRGIRAIFPAERVGIGAKTARAAVPGKTGGLRPRRSLNIQLREGQAHRAFAHRPGQVAIPDRTGPHRDGLEERSRRPGRHVLKQDLCASGISGDAGEQQASARPPNRVPQRRDGTRHAEGIRKVETAGDHQKIDGIGMRQSPVGKDPRSVFCRYRTVVRCSDNRCGKGFACGGQTAGQIEAQREFASPDAGIGQNANPAAATPFSPSGHGRRKRSHRLRRRGDSEQRTHGVHHDGSWRLVRATSSRSSPTSLRIWSGSDSRCTC